MGNVPVSPVIPRRKMARFLGKCPDWCFAPIPRIVIHKAVIKAHNELFEEDDDYWDSSLETSFSSLEEYLPKQKSCRRKSCAKFPKKEGNACSHLSETTQIEAIHEELKKLREQIAEYVLPKLVHDEVTSTVKTPTKPITPPPPPPLPNNLLTSIEDKVIDAKKNVLKDISNVKLRPITSTPMRVKIEPKPPDIRQDLYKILKKRYAAMHSPAVSKINEEFDDTDDENMLNTKIRNHNHVLVC